MNNVKQTTKNTAMLYVLTIAKLIFPLVTLPYLTRILTPDSYGVVSYVKACMSYMQIIIDFGFILSAVKEIAKAGGDKALIGKITGNVYLAKSLLALLSGAVIVILTFCIPILRAYKLFTYLYTVSIAISAFLGDFLFQGIEKMHVISIVYVIMKGISTALTFVFVKDDADLLWIPILEIVSTAVAVAVTWIFVIKFDIHVVFSGLKGAIAQLIESFVYFLSNCATTAFNILNTFLIGILITDYAQIAYWSVALQLVGAVQNLYSPIINGIYPEMVKSKDLGFIKKVLLLLMPVVTLGCVFCYFIAPWILTTISGEEYVYAVPVFRALLPLLLISFPAMLIGWPTLGAIDKNANVTFTTITSAIVQIIGLAILAIIGNFTIISIAWLRNLTELSLFSLRLYFVIKFRKQFSTS